MNKNAVPIISDMIDKPNNARRINRKSPRVIPTIIIKPLLNPEEKVRAMTEKTAGPGTIATINIAPNRVRRSANDNVISLRHNALLRDELWLIKI